MAKGRRNGTGNRKNGKRRNNRKPNFFQRIPQANNLMKSNPMVRYQYVDTIKFTPTVAQTAQLMGIIPFLANGLYQSGFSASNGVWGGSMSHVNSSLRPDGFQTYEDHYNHYVVLGSKISMRIRLDQNQSFVVGGTEKSKELFFALQLADDLGGFDSGGTVEEVKNQLNTVTRTMSYSNMAQAKQIYLTGTYSPKKQYNIKDTADNDYLSVDNIPTGVPSEFAYWKLFYKGAWKDDVLTLPDVFIDYKIDYIVKYQEPNVSSNVKQIPALK